MKAKILVLMAIIAATLSFVSPVGYDSLSSDQRIYIPAIVSEIHPENLSEDILLSFNQTKLTLFDELVVGLSRITGADIFQVMLVLTLIGRFVFFFSLAFLGKKFGLSLPGIGILLLVFLFPIEVYGTGMDLMESEFHPRFLSLALGLLSLFLIIDKKAVPSAVVWGLAFLIHPLSSLPFLVFYFWKIFVSEKSLPEKLALWILPLLFFIFPLLNFSETIGSKNPFFIDPSWWQILKDRSYYLFISGWSLEKLGKTLVDALLLGSLLFIFRKDKRNLVRKDALFLFFLPLFFFIFSWVFVDLFRVSIFASVQFSRFLSVWRILLPILLLVRITGLPQNVPNRYFRALSLAGFLAAFLFDNLLLEAVFLILFLAFEFFVKKDLLSGFQRRFEKTRSMARAKMSKVFPKKIDAGIAEWILFLLAVVSVVSWPSLAKEEIYPSEWHSSEFEKACDWLGKNTAPEDVVLAEPLTNEAPLLRTLCLRPVYVTEKDGAQAVFSRAYSLEWKRRKDALGNFKDDPEKIIDIARKENIKIIVSDNDKKKRKYIEKMLPVLGEPDFENERFLIWKVDNQ